MPLDARISTRNAAVRLGGSVAVAVGVVALTAALLIMLRQQTWREAAMRTANLVQLIGQDIDRNIEIFDLSLQAVQDGLRQPDLDGLSSVLRRMVLFDRSASAGDLGPIKVVDADGRVVLDSFHETVTPENVGGHDFFTVHRSSPGLGLYVSLPFDLASEGGAVIAFSRRINRPDGQFGGVIFGTLRLAYVQALFAEIDVGASGSISLFRNDGRLLIRSPYRPGDVGRDISGQKIYGSISSAPSGTFLGTSGFDSVERYYTFLHLKHGAAFVNVALGVDEILAAWWSRVAWVGCPVLLLAALTVLFSWRSEIHLAQRERAERRLKDVNDQLAELALTDGLTGLDNRRVFDQALTRELGRAARDGSPLALLLIDADHFKRVNDEHGHHVGDDVLKAIAGSLKAALRRAGDQACRVGGEEFAVILPATDRAGAVTVAEAIRAAIAGTPPGTPDRTIGGVTVSVGVCHVAAGEEIAAADVFARADQALYEAKRRGRNRVVAAGPAVRRPVLAAVSA